MTQNTGIKRLRKHRETKRSAKEMQMKGMYRNKKMEKEGKTKKQGLMNRAYWDNHISCSQR